jgi:hypothetical protein
LWQDIDGAVQVYRTAVDCGPKQAYAHRRLSTLLEEEKGDIGGAIQAEEGYIRAGNPEGDGEQCLQHLHRLRLRAVSAPELETATEALAQTAMAELLQEEEEGGGALAASSSSSSSSSWRREAACREEGQGQEEEAQGGAVGYWAIPARLWLISKYAPAEFTVDYRSRGPASTRRRRWRRSWPPRRASKARRAAAPQRLR